MQIIKRKSAHPNKNRNIDESSFSPSCRKKSSDSDRFSEMSLDEMIVDIVSAGYPWSKEEASVLLSRIWRLIENEISGDLNQPHSDETMKAQISRVSESYNAAVAKLKLLNMPFLRHGAVYDYFNSRA